MSNFPDHLNLVEAKIIDKVITRALEAGYHLAVYEGETGDIMAPDTTDRAAIQREVAATGITILRLTTQQENYRFERLGDLVLIHGNGEDVISDTNAPTNDKLDILENLIEGVTD